MPIRQESQAPTGKRRRRRKGMCLADRPLSGAQRSRHRYRSAGNLRRRTGGSGQPSRPQVRNLHRRSAPDGRMAGCLWRHHGGNGVYRRLLDSGLRRAGTTRHPAVPGESAEHEECAGKTDRLSRVSVDPASAFDGTFAFGLPAGGRGLLRTFADAASPWADFGTTWSRWPASTCSRCTRP